MNIPITRPYLDDSEVQSCKESISSGWVSQGPKVKEFEKKICNIVGARYGIATTSCTTSLHTALAAMGIGKGDEVIVPSYSFIATANSVLYQGARPIFVDIDPLTYNIDPEKIEEKVSEHTKCIMPVHQVGLPADLDKIDIIAKKKNVLVLEDAACALGSEYKGKKIGNINPACFSFHPRKVITCGEGGMITTNDKRIYEKSTMIRSHGASVSDLARHESKDIIFEEYDCLGYNYRMTDIQASIGLEQVKKLSRVLEMRRELAERYNDLLNTIDKVTVPFVPKGLKHTYQSYIIKIEGKNRNQVMQELLEKGIATRRGIMAIHTEPYYVKRFGKISLPVTEDAVEKTIVIPLFPGMTEEEQDYVVKHLKKVLG